MADSTEHTGYLAHLCELLPRLRRTRLDPQSAADVAALVERARAGQELGHDLVRLCRRLGVPEPAPNRAGWPWDDSAGRGVHGLFTCPGARCPRTWVQEPGVPVPECGIDGDPLLRPTGGP